MNGSSRSKILDLPELLRPREKALYYGISALTDVELLALIIGKGVTNFNAIALAELLINEHISLKNLAKFSSPEPLLRNGIGRVKALQIIAAFELGKRINLHPENDQVQTYDKAVISKKYQHIIGNLTKEVMYLVILSKSLKIISEKQIYIGNESGFILDTKEIVRELLLVNAGAYVLIHNHPSGNARPSYHDIEGTRKLSALSKLFGVYLFDHLIVTTADYYSFREQDDLWQN